MIIRGHHRSFDLAERHAREIAKQNDDAEIKITRRDQSGKFSNHGREFFFEVVPLKKEINSIAEWNDLDFIDTEDTEVVSNADY